MNTNEEECASLSQRIADLIVVASNPWAGKTDDDIPLDTKIMIESLRE
jgi:hypothetical protein